MEINRYNNSKIYKLIDMINGFFYIGSTCLPLSKRLHWHKINAKCKGTSKMYKHFNIIGWENVDIILYQEHYLENKEQLRRAENDVIMTHINDTYCLNMRKAYISEEDLKTYMKNYYKQEHVKEKRNLYNKHHYYENRELILNNQKEYKKQYYQDNREKQLENQKEYYKKHKNDERRICCCGGTYVKWTIKTHEKSKKHQAWLKDEKQSAETI